MRLLLDAARAAAEIARRDPTEFNLATVRTVIASAIAVSSTVGSPIWVDKGPGYNPNRDERGRFASGPSSGQAEAHGDAAVTRAAAAVDRAQGKRAAAEAKLAALRCKPPKLRPGLPD